MDISSLSGLIAFLGTAAAFGFVKSQFLEKQKWFMDLTADNKVTVTLVGAVLLGLLSYVLQTYVPGAVITGLQPIYSVIFSAVVIWSAGQAFHNVSAPAKITTTTTTVSPNAPSATLTTSTTVSGPTAVTTGPGPIAVAVTTSDEGKG